MTLWWMDKAQHVASNKDIMLVPWKPSAPGQAFESNYGFNTYMVAECTQVEADVSIWW